ESDPFNIIRPILGSTPATITFPNTYNLATSNEVNFNFTNTSIVDSKICQTISITGDHASDFTITQNNCSFQNIGAQSSGDMGMNVTPTGKGIRTAQMNRVCGNESYSTSLSVESLNNPPVVASSITHDMRYNSSWTFSLPAGSDIDNDLNDLVYRIVEGPSTGTLSSCLSSIDFNINRDCTYTAPRDFHGTVTIKYIISDGSDQSETQGFITINVEDQSATEPTLSPINFISGGYTTHSLLTFTSSSCHDVSAIIIQETATPPAIASPAWQSCATTNGAITFNPQEETPPAQGSRTL